MILHLEFFRPVVQVMEPFCPPDVVHGGDEGKVNHHFPVELTKQFLPGATSFAIPGSFFVHEECGANKERHHRPHQGQAGPPRVVRGQLQEGEEVCSDIR